MSSTDSDGSESRKRPLMTSLATANEIFSHVHDTDLKHNIVKHNIGLYSGTDSSSPDTGYVQPCQEEQHEQVQVSTHCSIYIPC